MSPCISLGSTIVGDLPAQFPTAWRLSLAARAGESAREFIPLGAGFNTDWLELVYKYLSLLVLLGVTLRWVFLTDPQSFPVRLSVHCLTGETDLITYPLLAFFPCLLLPFPFPSSFTGISWDQPLNPCLRSTSGKPDLNTVSVHYQSLF